MKYKELIKLIEADGWYMVSSNKHRKYRHRTKSGLLTIPFHTGEIPTGTAMRILKDARIKS